MNWCTRRKNSKPSLMNLIKRLLKCQDTKCNIYINFYFIRTIYTCGLSPNTIQSQDKKLILSLF